MALPHLSLYLVLTIILKTIQAYDRKASQKVTINLHNEDNLGEEKEGDKKVDSEAAATSDVEEQDPKTGE
jgi:hypothetical protein